MKVQILGPGCPKCELLAKNAAEAAARLGLDCEIEKVKDIMDITRLGVMSTPGLVVDGQVKSVGKVLTVDKIVEMLK